MDIIWTQGEAKCNRQAQSVSTLVVFNSWIEENTFIQSGDINYDAILNTVHLGHSFKKKANFL